MARGDHIRVRRDFYWHHGIDCGDGEAIHYNGDVFHRRDAAVRRTPLEQFSRGRTVEVVESPREDQIEEVMARAASRIGETAYSVVANNCEHFATWCLTGRPRSRQVRRSVKRAVAGTITAAIVATALVRVASRAARGRG